MSNNLVVVKFPDEVRTVNVELGLDLEVGESLVSAVVLPSVPAGLTVSVGAPSGTFVPLTMGVGTDGQSYGVTVEVTTDLPRVISKLVAVVCNAQIAYDYQNVNMDAFSTLLGELEAGQAAVGNVAFMFPLPFDTAGGQVAWDLIDKDGAVLSSGTSFGYTVTTLTDSVKIESQSVVNVPSDALPTLEGQAYQIRWRLLVGGQAYYSFETLRVTAQNTAPVGPEDVIEMFDVDIPVSVIFSKPYENVAFEIYQQNERVSGTVPVNARNNTKVSDGWLYTGEMVGMELPVQLDAYTILWTGWNTNRAIDRERLSGRVFITNASILQAIADMRMTLNKSRSTIHGLEDLLFTEPAIMSYLRFGRDYFNGAGAGMLTSFTMHNAQGAIREFWIRCSLVAALRAQYLAEGEKAFNFGGQAITLDVDRTQYYQSLTDQLKSELDAELKPFKQNLIKKGIIGGDGNIDPVMGLRPRPGAGGSVGITLTPASNWSKWGGRYGGRR